MARRKKSNGEQPEQSEMLINLEIDIQALRGKNKQLVQTVAKLQQEKGTLQKQIGSFQEEYFKLNSKYVNLKNIFKTIDSTTKVCFPKMAEMVNHMAKVMHLCSVGSAVSSLNKDPKTQTVQPHIVNGTILNNPTITLSRFTDSEGNSTDTPPRNNRPALVSTPRRRNQSFAQDAAPSTSRGSGENRQSGNQQRNGDIEENETVNFVSSRYHRTAVQLDSSDEEEQDEQNHDNGFVDNDSEEDDDSGEFCGRLLPIEEEGEEYNSMNSSPPFTDRVREIRIYLSPLSTEQTNQQNDAADLSYVARTSSLSAEASNSIQDENNTLLNDTHDSPNQTVTFMDHTSEPHNCSVTSPSRTRDGFSRSEGTTWIRRTTRILDGPSTSFESNISSIEPRNSPQKIAETSSTSTTARNEDLKIYTLKSLGLSPSVHQLTTSTPIGSNSRSSKRNSKQHDRYSDAPRKSSTSMDTSQKSSVRFSGRLNKSPDNTRKSSDAAGNSSIVSNITKRKSSSAKQLAQVVLQRVSLDKSSLETIKEVFDTVPITSVSEMRRKKSSKTTAEAIGSAEDVSDLEQSIQIEENVKNARRAAIKKKGKENRKLSTSSESNSDDSSGVHTDSSDVHTDSSSVHTDSSGVHIDNSGSHTDNSSGSRTDNSSGSHTGDSSGSHTDDSSGSHTDNSGSHTGDSSFSNTDSSGSRTDDSSSVGSFDSSKEENLNPKRSKMKEVSEDVLNESSLKQTRSRRSNYSSKACDLNTKGTEVNKLPELSFDDTVAKQKPPGSSEGPKFPSKTKKVTTVSLSEGAVQQKPVRTKFQRYFDFKTINKHLQRATCKLCEGENINVELNIRNSYTYPVKSHLARSHEKEFLAIFPKALLTNSNKSVLKKKPLTAFNTKLSPLSPIAKIRSSPRPTRAARPTVLREMSLRKKMRRSK